jgi:hypothetical protein
MLIAGTLVETTQRRFRHELTHRFLDHRMPALPPWLEEGLAEYYSTLKVESGDAVIGTLPNTKILRIDIHLISSLVQGMADDRVDLDQVPSVEKLLTADFDTFHDPAHDLAYYAGAWTFVHMMLNGPYGYAPRFNRFLDLLAAGTPPSDAWNQCFWLVPLAKLEKNFKDYVGRTEMDARAQRVSVPRAKKVERERPLTEADVHLMLARIRPWDSRESILAAGRELAEARALSGGQPSAELHYWSGLYASRWRHYDEAERELRQAIALEPGRARHWLALAQALSHEDRPETETQLAEVVAHLLPLARSAQALNFIALYYTHKGQADAGLPFAKRAVAAEHGCWECMETLSVLQNLAHAATGGGVGDDKMYTKPTID